MERVKGIEPSYEAWEAAVLPLNYTREDLILRDRTASSLELRTAIWADSSGHRGTESLTLMKAIASQRAINKTGCQYCFDITSTANDIHHSYCSSFRTLILSTIRFEKVSMTG
jgi:hypothetical protein